ncbi:hypothetical protein ACMXYW_02765 [Neptuniibacter sp. QD48_55]|uniref:hypothetical protein n=1 Tax=Neptuniibacter sp. QD48_55 TaxID=3398212 RepID=UPI0039F4AF3A
MDYEGIMPGLTISSPLFFYDDERIDYGTLGRYLDDVCANDNVSAVYSMAYNTRYRMLDDDEVYEVNKFIVERVKKNNKKVYVGHPYVFTSKVLDNYLKKISMLPVDGVSMLYPERYYGIDEPIIEFLNAPVKYGLNIVLHEMKLVSGFNGELINWPASLLQKVFKEVDLVAVKEDSKDDQITDLVLDLCKENNVHCVLAGGGKVRAQRFFDKGLTTWLNGSTMFAPMLIDRTYKAFLESDTKYTEYYLLNIEKPFFENIVAKHGWHLAHKAALEFMGYGKRFERFPHAVVSQEDYEKLLPVLRNIKHSINELENL